jgi:hypothetical protein
MGDGRQERKVRVQTLSGPIEGSLLINARLRTLDDLNVVSKRFVTLHSVGSASHDWSFDEATLAVNKSSILFLQELSAQSVQPGSQFDRFTRASIRVRVGDFDIQGFVHVPPGGAAMKRLDQNNHAFVSLTSALITGPDTQSTAPFLAVNRNHIIAAQEVGQVESASVKSTGVEVET